jgi:hypothetical protein
MMECLVGHHDVPGAVGWLWPTPPMGPPVNLTGPGPTRLIATSSARASCGDTTVTGGPCRLPTPVPSSPCATSCAPPKAVASTSNAPGRSNPDSGRSRPTWVSPDSRNEAWRGASRIAAPRRRRQPAQTAALLTRRDPPGLTAKRFTPPSADPGPAGPAPLRRPRRRAWLAAANNTISAPTKAMPHSPFPNSLHVAVIATSG